MNITVLQWNVLYQEKAENILEFLQQTDADIVCLQELTADSTINPGRNIPIEITQLGYELFYCASIETEGFIMGNGIFSKFPVLNSRKVYVRQEDIDDSDKLDPHHENRIYVEVTIQVGPSTLTVGTVHLSFTPRFEPMPWKDAETNKLINAIKTNRKNFLLTGDFNALPDSATIRQLDELLKPAGPDYTKATWTTKPFDFEGFKADSLSWRMDYVFTSSDIQVADSKILQTNYSDHLPLLTTLSF